MDTRGKILPPDQFIAVVRDPFVAVSGYFDVLQPSTIRDLQGAVRDGEKLLAIVLDPPSPSVLSSAARTELAASLRVIDYVVHLPDDPSPFILGIEPIRYIRQEERHLGSTGRLIGHVWERHGRAREWRPRD